MKMYHFETVDSTSTYLKNNYDKLNDFTFVSADYQSQGHGRYGRKWFGENKKDLMFSILIKDKDLISRYSHLSLSSAVVIHNILKEINIKNVSIKWPNDVFVNDEKIAGVLLESVSYEQEIKAIVVGVGLNVNSTSFVSNMINTPTSICKELDKEISLDMIKKQIYECFIAMFEKIKNEDYSYIDIVRNNNYLKDKMVYASINGVKMLVKVVDIGNDNSLIVNKDNADFNITSGEITFHEQD